MKALSLWEPWASLVAIGAKKIETRSWETRHRGWLAIHASKTWRYDSEEQCRREPFARTLRQHGYEPNTAIWRQWGSVLPLGCIIAVAYLDRCFEFTQNVTYEFPDGCRIVLAEPELSFGDFAPGRFGWVFPHVYRLATPVPCRGHQSLFDLPADIEAQVRGQIGEVPS